MSYVLIVTIISSFGAITTDKTPGYSSYEDCATDAVGRIESMRPFYPDSKIRWDCQHD